MCAITLFYVNLSQLYICSLRENFNFYPNETASNFNDSPSHQQMSNNGQWQLHCAYFINYLSKSAKVRHNNQQQCTVIKCKHTAIYTNIHIYIYRYAYVNVAALS